MTGEAGALVPRMCGQTPMPVPALVWVLLSPLAGSTQDGDTGALTA